MSSAGSEDKAGEALDSARQFAEEGQFEQALERHVWLHDHALEFDPSFHGVRLSFALSDWVRLGAKYPPALEKLESIRDAKTARIEAGADNWELFSDIQSINKYLGEENLSVALFKKIDEERPDFAAEIFNVVADTLIRTKNYILARKHLGNPDERLSFAKDVFNSGLQFEDKYPDHVNFKKEIEDLFAWETVRIITILDAAGDTDTALRIQKDALKVVSHPEIRNALNP